MPGRCLKFPDSMPTNPTCHSVPFLLITLGFWSLGTPLSLDTKTSLHLFFFSFICDVPYTFLIKFGCAEIDYFGRRFSRLIFIRRWVLNRFTYTHCTL